MANPNRSYIRALRIMVIFGQAALLSSGSPAQTLAAPCTDLKLKAPLRIVNVGENIEFSVESKSHDPLEDFSFEWRVEGSSFSGQGSPRIVIRTGKGDGLRAIKATVVVADKNGRCSISISEYAAVNSEPPGPNHFWFDLGKPTANDLKAQLDVFFAELANNPGAEGLIEITFVKPSDKAKTISTLKRIDRHISYRHFDPRRISYYVRQGEVEGIRIIKMSQGADFSYFGIDQSKLLKAEQFKNGNNRILPKK